jgi:hypothetical protein
MSSHVTAAPLRPAEGVPLSYALLDRIGRDVGTRTLAIKGPVPAAWGLRSPRESGDADVLVEPAGVDLVCEALTGLGWSVKPVPAAAPASSLHSDTLRHPQWPNEIDLHFRYPGFLVAPQVAFEALWRERRPVEIAGREVAATGPLGSALVLALHALREPDDPRNRDELADLVQRLRERPDQHRDLVAFAEESGATGAVLPLFERLGCAPDGDVPLAQREALATWRLRLDARSAPGADLLVELGRTPAWRWPALAARVVLGDATNLRRRYPAVAATRFGLARARLCRIRDMVGDLPGALRVAQRYFRERRR